jgi:diguanylate cyclase (GGDEF)-like protein
LRKTVSKSGWAAGLFLLGLWVLFAVSTVCAAQRYSFREYGNGLSNLNICCMVQDRTGYLWAGTENGLYRFDGSQFRRYGAADGLPSRLIQSLFVGPDGTLWVGTPTGIYFRRQDGRFVEVRPAGAVKPLFVRVGTTFTADRPNLVVAATRDGAYLLRQIGTDQWTAEAMHLEGNEIWSVQYDADGALWYGCDLDLCRYADGTTKRMSAKLKLPSDKWLHLLPDHKGHIWMRGAVHLGELMPAESRFALHDLPAPAQTMPYETLAEDAHGRIVASDGPAFGIWEAERWHMVTVGNGLPHLDISGLFVDREGSFWIAVVGHGLMQWLGEDTWEAYTSADGLSDDTVWATARDKKGRLWIGTESGLDWIPSDGGDPRVWHAAGIQTSRSVALAVSQDGAIWLGSATGNLVRIDPSTLSATQWKVPEVYRILAQSPHHLWIATTGGLYSVDPLKWQQTPRLVTDPAIANPKGRFTDLTQGPADQLWAASDQGLFRLDEKGWTRIDPGKSSQTPSVIAVDQQGTLWAGGPSQTVMRMRISGNRIVEANPVGRPPLLSEQVLSILVDHRGWVWMGQDMGLSVYNGHSWRSFTHDDGLIWNDTDSYALMEDTDGSIWIGTSGGVSHLMEPKTAPTGPQPAPAFSQVSYGNETLKNGGRVKWNSGALVISIASLSFRDTHDIGIRYRLLGKSGYGWEETHDMLVRYRRLMPGNYQFEAVSVDAQGSALSPVGTFTFEVEPRWWQNLLVQFLLAILAAFLVVAIWRWRIDQLLKQKRQLEAAVQQRTEALEREKAELVRTREQMRHYAEHDGLTGLWNHRIIVNRLQAEVSRSRREGSQVSVILADLDHFKNINDTYGHQVGDSVLRETGSILQGLVRSYDWVGRYGGEEFLLILPGSSMENALDRAEELRAAVMAASIPYDGEVIRVTASFGVASGMPDNYQAMIQAADAALYRAKESGRNRVDGAEIFTHDSSAASSE